jgi:hypothetical protein
LSLFFSFHFDPAHTSLIQYCSPTRTTPTAPSFTSPEGLNQSHVTPSLLALFFQSQISLAIGRSHSRRLREGLAAAGMGEPVQGLAAGVGALGGAAQGRAVWALLFPHTPALPGDAFHAKVGLGNAIFDSVMAAMTPNLSPCQDAKATP